jgi:rare lipoprotein A
VKNFLLFVTSIVSFALSGCMTKEERFHAKLSKEDPKNLEYKGTYKIGSEYTVKGKTYKPCPVENKTEIGIASWYDSVRFHKAKTANGDRYDKNLLTAAHPSMPMPSLVKVVNIKNNKSVIVLVNDRGPFIKDRIIDVSEKVADILGFKQAGTAKVKLEYLNKETKEFLKVYGLIDSVIGYQKKGKKQKRPSNKMYAHCSINCYVKLVNKEHNTSWN